MIGLKLRIGILLYSLGFAGAICTLLFLAFPTGSLHSSSQDALFVLGCLLMGIAGLCTILVTQVDAKRLCVLTLLNASGGFLLYAIIQFQLLHDVYTALPFLGIAVITIMVCGILMDRFKISL